MSAKMGRLHKEVAKSVNLELRLAPDTAEKPQKCVYSLKLSQTMVMENGIAFMGRRTKNKVPADPRSQYRNLINKSHPEGVVNLLYQPSR